MCEWSEVTSWEGWENNEVVQWERWEHNKGVAIGKGERVVNREGGMEFRDKIVLYCSRDAKCMQGFNNNYLMLWVIVVNGYQWPSGQCIRLALRRLRIIFQ